jgi:hypothetical protein
MTTATFWLCRPATLAACCSLSGFCGNDRAETNQRSSTSRGAFRGTMRSPFISNAACSSGARPYQTASSFHRPSCRLSPVMLIAAMFG